MSDFDISDMRKHLGEIESRRHGEYFDSVFDLVHAVHSELLNIARATVAHVNQNLSNRLPEGVVCEIVANPDDHPHMRPQHGRDHDWETISRYIELGVAEFGDEDITVNVRAKVRLSDHRRKKNSKGESDDSEIVWVKFKINKYIMVRSAEGTEYRWKSLAWKPQKVDLMNERNTPAPGAGREGRMIVNPTFYIHSNARQTIRTDARKRIPSVIHDCVESLIERMWDEAGTGSAPS